MNLPMFIPGEEGKLHVFTHNLGLFAGVLLPPDVKEPARTLSDLATVLGMVNDFGPRHDFPIDKLARELQEYYGLHSYTSGLRISVSNPGDASVLASALHTLYESFPKEQPLPHLDVLAHCSEPVPIELPVLDRLRERLYTMSAQTGSHLSPLVQIAIREASQMTDPAGGDVNLAVLFDPHLPVVEMCPPVTRQDSAAAYGLIHRVSSEFRSDAGCARWTHQIVYGTGTNRQKNPVTGQTTGELIETHTQMLRGIARLRGDSAPDKHVSLTLSLDEHARAGLDLVHRRADWVILMDRFLGVELFDDASDTFFSALSRKYLLDYAPEFIDGLGHRLVVTTMWREEVEEILARAMRELGFNAIEESVGEALQQLKSISGRLALRLIRDNSRAREAASLGVLVAWLKRKGQLANSVLIPVDAHPEIFSAGALADGANQNRCDLIQLRFGSSRTVDATFIEVKSRHNQANYVGLAERMCDQMESTENQFRALFFSGDRRLDHVLQRSKLVGILRFYALRGHRYGYITEEAVNDLLEAIEGLEAGYPSLRTSRLGFVVDLAGKKQKPVSQRGAVIRILTAADFDSGLPFPIDPDVLNEEPTAKVVIDVESTAHPAPMAAYPETSPAFPEIVHVALGRNGAEQEIVWSAAVKGSPHLFILGIPGQGKSWLATRLLLGMHRQNLPSLILDFHGQFSAPDSPYVQEVKPKIWDVASGLPFSPFEFPQEPDAWKANCFAVAEILQYVFQLGDIQRGVVYDAMRDCYLEAGVGEYATPVVLPRFEALEKNIRRYEHVAGARNTLIRCKPLFEFNMFDENLAATAPVNLLEASRRGLVIDLHRMSMESVQLAAGAFVLRKLYKDMFSWGETDRLRVAIVLDEAHRICCDNTLPKIMKEGRKFGVAVVAATQQLDDFHPDVIGNAGTKVVFRTNHPASRKVAGFLRMQKGVDVVDLVEQLPVGNALVQTPDMRDAELVAMYPVEKSESF